MILITALLVATLINPAATIDSVAKRDRAVSYLHCGGEQQPGQAESPRADSTDSAEYLSLVSEQRAAVTEAINVVQEFLVNANSLDQQKRTRFLQAVVTLQSSAEAAAALVPPPELAAVHRRHVDALVTLATVGDLYLAGMDTHDPTQYERASRTLARGGELFAAVSDEMRHGSLKTETRIGSCMAHQGARQCWARVKAEHEIVNDVPTNETGT